MNDSGTLGFPRITKEHLRALCKKHNLYLTPHLNDQLFLHYQGFQSIENLEEYIGLKSLWLECNAISEIQGLEELSGLKCLFLQNNLIKKIENLQYCSALDTLNLSSNHITKIENCGIDILPVLSTLNLSRNYLQNSDAIRELLNCKTLCSLDLSHNRIDDILVVKIFAEMPELKVLVLQGNPVVSKVPQYRKTMILQCKKLTYLDSHPVFPIDRACSEAWKRGGYEEERKERNRWNKLERKRTRDSINATLRFRQTRGAGDVHFLESTDDENEEGNKSQKIPEVGKSTDGLKKIGVVKEVGYNEKTENTIEQESAQDISSDKKDQLFNETCVQDGKEHGIQFNIFSKSEEQKHSLQLQENNNLSDSSNQNRYSSSSSFEASFIKELPSDSDIDNMNMKKKETGSIRNDKGTNKGSDSSLLFLSSSDLPKGNTSTKSLSSSFESSSECSTSLKSSYDIENDNCVLKNEPDILYHADCQQLINSVETNKKTDSNDFPEINISKFSSSSCQFSLTKESSGKQLSQDSTATNKTNLTESIYDAGTSPKNVYSVLRKENSDNILSPLTLRDPINQIALKDDHADIFHLNEFTAEKLVEGTFERFWHDRNLHSKDTSASSSPENPPFKNIIEEIVDNDSCLVLCDDTIASNWSEQYLNDKSLEKSTEETVKEIESRSDEEIKRTTNQTNENTTKLLVSEEIPSNLNHSNLLRKKNEIENKTSDPKAKENINKADLTLSKEESQILNFAEEEQYFETEFKNKFDKKDFSLPFFDKGSKRGRRCDENDLLDCDSKSLSWWERTLIVARSEVSKLHSKVNKNPDEDNKSESRTSILAEESDQDQTEIPEKSQALQNQSDASCFLPQTLKQVKEYEKGNGQNAQVTLNKDKNNSMMLETKSAISSDLSLGKTDTNSGSTLDEVIPTFNKVFENISSRNRLKSQLLKELISDPLPKTFSAETGDEINHQIGDKEKLPNYVDCVFTQKEQYDDSLEVDNGCLTVGKGSTGALELPLSQPTESTKYINCGVSCGTSTNPTSSNIKDNDSDSDDYGTALSEDNHTDNEDDDDDEKQENHDIKEHASDTNIKGIHASYFDVNYCTNESVSLSSADWSTETEKEEDNNHHHSVYVDVDVNDSQQSVAERLHNEVDSEVVPELKKLMHKKEGPRVQEVTDYKISRKGGVKQTKMEFQEEMSDYIQSIIDIGENVTAMEDIALIFELPGGEQ